MHRAGGERPADAAVPRPPRGRAVEEAGGAGQRGRAGPGGRGADAGAVDLPRPGRGAGRRPAEAVDPGRRAGGAGGRGLPRRRLRGGLPGGRAAVRPGAGRRRARPPSATSSRGCRRSRRRGCTWRPPTRSSPSRAPTTTRPSRWRSSWAARSTAGRRASPRRRPSRTPPPGRWPCCRPARRRAARTEPGQARRASGAWRMADDRPSTALIPADVVAVCRRLREAGHEAHLVGGGVRDLVLGRAPKDFDLATSALPDAVMELFGQRFAIPTGLQHGTVTVLTGSPPPGRPVEVTTFRGEGCTSTGGGPSSVEFGKTLNEDLARRDFTMNAIAYDPLADRLTDPFGGQAGSGGASWCGRWAIRCSASARTACGRCGPCARRPSWASPSIRPPLQAIPPDAGVVPQGLGRAHPRRAVQDPGVAGEPARGFELLRETGLLARGRSPSCSRGWAARRTAFTASTSTGTRWPRWRRRTRRRGAAPGGAAARRGQAARARSPRRTRPASTASSSTSTSGAEMAVTIGQRLKLPNAERESVRLLVANHMFYYTPDWTDGTIRRFVRRVGVDELPALLALREADVAGRGFGEDPREGDARAAPAGGRGGRRRRRPQGEGSGDRRPRRDAGAGRPPGRGGGRSARGAARAGAGRSGAEHAANGCPNWCPSCAIERGPTRS